MSKSPPRFYFSFRSPYSWIAARRLQEKVPLDQLNLEYIPSWEPGEQILAAFHARGGKMPYAQMSRDKHFYILQDIKRLAKHFGYRMAWPIDRDPAWDLPHLGYLAARRAGKDRAFFWGAYRIRWEEGGDLCSMDTLRALATDIDLDPQVIEAAMQDPGLQQEGTETLYRGYRDGVFGVPFFITGHEKFWGVDRLDFFLRALTGQPAKPL
ncbi:MAG: DsbA family protein [Acidobacteriaceae bacterium]|nr:DsbA family protein [Acidobacteriaceae bacterium]